jgi:hypothetical protein
MDIKIIIRLIRTLWYPDYLQLSNVKIDDIAESLALPFCL